MAYYTQGNFTCQIKSQGFGTSEKKGTPFFFLRFTPLAREDGQDFSPSQYDDEVRLYLTDNTVERAAEVLKGIGWDGSSWVSLEPEGGCSLVGETVVLRCEHHRDENTGKVYDKWEFPAPGRESAESIKGAGRRLDALFGKVLAKTPKPDPATVGASDDGDEIPF